MQTITTKLEESRARLVQQGSQLVQQTSTAATTFLEKTKKASERFATDTRKAADAFSAATTNAGKSFAGGLSAEARMWLKSVETSVRVPKLASNDGTKLPSPRVLEREVLVRIEKTLDKVAHQLHARVKLLDTMTGPQLPASTATTPKSGNGAKSVAAATKVPTSAPITGYDELSAKDIVSRLERLSDEKTAAVLAYENANKKRATIVRAAEQRLAEA